MSLMDPSLRVFFYKRGSKIHEDSDFHFHLKSQQVSEQMFGCFANWVVVSHLEAAVFSHMGHCLFLGQSENLSEGTVLHVCLKHSCAVQLPSDE